MIREGYIYRDREGLVGERGLDTSRQETECVFV